MVVNKVAENVFGTTGTICWTIQLIPQIVKSFRSKSTDGLSEWLLLIWALSGPFMGIYNIVQNLNIPLIIQPQLFTTFATMSWIECQRYGNRRPWKTCILMFSGFMIIMGGFEVGMIFAVKPAFRAGNFAPVRFFGITSSVLISIGVLPQYYEIYKHKEVVGISMLFMYIDTLGGVFSILSLVFKGRFDIVAALPYSFVVVLDGIIILCYFILNPAAKRRRRREQEALSATNTLVTTTPERKPPEEENLTPNLPHV